MFGMGGSEIIVILIVALLFLGPEKLPSAAKTISKGIRDIKKQSRSLQQQLESDEQIGGAIRDLKSALRGEELPSHKPRPKRQLDAGAIGTENTIHGSPDGTADEIKRLGDKPIGWLAPPDGETQPAEPADQPALTLPSAAGEPDAGSTPPGESDDELASLVKPVAGTVAKGS